MLARSQHFMPANAVTLAHVRHRWQHVKPGVGQIRNIARNVPPFGGNCGKTVGWIFTFYSSYETLKQWQLRYIIRFYVRLLEDSFIEFRK